MSASPTATAVQLPEDPGSLRALVLELLSKVSVLEEQLRLAVHQRFASKSEKLAASPDQLHLFAEAAAAASAVAGENPSPDTADARPARARPRGKRRPIDASLPRVRVEHDIPEAQKTCPCGCQMTRIGETMSEQLDIEPAKARVIQNVRFKYACRKCEGTSHDGPVVVIAPLPAQPIPKSNASPGLLAYITTSKFQDGIPHYRLESILGRTGIHLPRATSANWTIRLGDLVTPLTNLLDEAQLSYGVLQMDETTVQVLKEAGREAEAKSFMWVRRGGEPGRPIILFDYEPSRSAAVPMRILADYKGFLQTDGYAGYDKPGQLDDIIHVGCMGHARRKFHDAVKAQLKAGAAVATGLAAEALAMIRKLYVIEKAAREAHLKPAQRKQLRDARSRPILDELRVWLDRHLGTVPPQTLTGKALNYLASEWPRLVRYLDDGRLEIDNNLCENVIRPFVMGRKAWLFCDTPAGARAAARLYGLIETAKANGLEPYAYLRHVFTELPKAVTLADVEALLPWNVAPPATQSVAA